MLELLSTIALLCQIGTGSLARLASDRYQLTCQKDYTACVFKENVSAFSETQFRDKAGKRLADCVLKREIND